MKMKNMLIALVICAACGGEDSPPNLDTKVQAVIPGESEEDPARIPEEGDDVAEVYELPTSSNEEPQVGVMWEPTTYIRPGETITYTFLTSTPGLSHVFEVSFRDFSPAHYGPVGVKYHYLDFEVVTDVAAYQLIRSGGTLWQHTFVAAPGEYIKRVIVRHPRTEVPMSGLFDLRILWRGSYPISTMTRTF